MIVTLQAKSPDHRRAIQFRAVIHGLPADPIGETFVDLTVRYPGQALNIIREVGGTVIAAVPRVPLTNAERFS